MIIKFNIKKKIKEKKNKGFTLIELLAVVALLAVIMVITIPTVINSIKNAKQSSFNSAGESIVKYLDDNYKNCKLKNESIAKYDKAIFDADCNLIKDNLSKNVITNSGYSINDIEKVELYNLENGKFSVVVYPNLTGKFSDTKMFYKNIYVNDCWWLMPIGEENYKLIKFLGINHDNGNINGMCGIEEDDKNLYSITIPANVDGRKIVSLSNDLFSVININDKGDIESNKFLNIGKITISEGIISIEKGVVDFEKGIIKGTFLGIGANEEAVIEYINDFFKPGPFDLESLIINDRKLEITLPDSLEYIGDAAFGISAINELNIPAGVKEIGDYAFSFDTHLKKINFNSDGNLTKIGNHSFSFAAIGYDEENQLIIPKSVVDIGAYSFASNSYLKKLTFSNDSALKTIGEGAFANCNLEYTSDSLIIPSGVEKIGEKAFFEQKDNNLNYIKFMGTREKLNTLGTSWYKSNVNVKAYGE